MDDQAIEKAATLLWRTRLAGHRLDAIPADCRPPSLDDGYRIQDFMTAHTGKRVVGWKVAATTEAGRRRMGISAPLAGRLFDGYVLADGAKLDAGPMTMLVAEPEFAFRLGRDLPSRAQPYTTDNVLEAVVEVRLAIEVPDARVAGFNEIGAPSTVADDAFAGWVILGPTVAGWRDLDLPTRPVRALRNGTLAGENRGQDALGDPCQALVWLAQDRAIRGTGLKSGDVVITGTRIAPVAIHPGDRVSFEFPDLGKVSAAFD
jgi:2-keto-4-pentenoate hydratase